MARDIKEDEITEVDLQEFLDSSSDFGFELKILRSLRELGLPCLHGGYYEDPKTKTAREFDIRSTHARESFLFQLAIECKNLRKNNPLLISCAPRKEAEAYHEVAIFCEPEERQGPFGLSNPTAPLIPKKIFSHRLRQSNLYPEGSAVGKSTAQVSRLKNGAILSNDSGIYEKWGQALASLDEMVSDLSSLMDKGMTGLDKSFGVAIPIVVVPDGTLWECHYSDDGSISVDPRKADRVSSFTGMSYSIGMFQDDLSISHIEFFTETGLLSFINDYVISPDGPGLLLSGGE